MAAAKVSGFRSEIHHAEAAKQGTSSTLASDKFGYSGRFRFGADIRGLIPASFWGGGVVVNDEFSHLHAPYRAYALLSASERIQWIRQDRWIHYSRAEQVLNRLSDLLTYPPRDRMPCLLLFGPTGMGKTRIVQKFLREHRSSFDDVTGRTRLPIVALVAVSPIHCSRN
jgi:Bacterial TniB protein